MAKTLKNLQLFETGAVIGNRYRVLDVIGAGAVGTVLRVSDEELDREIAALKVLHPHLVADKCAMSRFQNEVIVCRQLAHPNIVRVYDFEGIDSQALYFLSMECIQGPNLREYLNIHKGRRLAFEDATRVLHHLALALCFAHEKGVVHRDIKPENILLSTNGEAKLSDFGLAYTLQSSIGLTATGEALGTPYYMSPEAFCGEKLDPQSDIYSLGIVAYEIVTGNTPFQQENILAVAKSHLEQPFCETPLVDAGAASWYVKLVRRCLEKERNERFRNCNELLDYLRTTAAETLVSPQLTLRMHRKSRVIRQQYLPASLRYYLRSLAWIMLLLVLLLVLVEGNTRGRVILLSSIYKLEKGFDIELRPVKKFFGLSTMSAREPDALAKSLRQEDQLVIRALRMVRPDYGYLDEDGNTILHLALSWKNGKQLDELSPLGMPVNWKNKNGDTPLHIATKAGLFGPMEFLLSANADPNFEDAEGNTALHLAAIAKDAKSLQLLLDNSRPRIILPGRNRAGKTVLHIAARNCDVASLVTLLRRGADPNVIDANGRTPLVDVLRSFSENAEDAAVTLLRFGADTRLRDINGLSVYDHARATGHEKILQEASAIVFGANHDSLGE